MNNGSIGSYYDNAYLNYDAGKFKAAGQAGNSAEAAKVNMSADNVAVMLSDSLSSPEMTANQFVKNALKEAGITSNDRTMQLVNELLLNHQPVDKNTLMNYNRLIKMFPDVDVKTLLQMKLNNIPINQEMIAQYEQYSNNSGYIMKDLAVITDGLSELLRNLSAGSGKEAAVNQLESIVSLVKDMTGATGEAGNNVGNISGQIFDEGYGNQQRDLPGNFGSTGDMVANLSGADGSQSFLGLQQGQNPFVVLNQPGAVNSQDGMLHQIQNGQAESLQNVGAEAQPTANGQNLNNVTQANSTSQQGTIPTDQTNSANNVLEGNATAMSDELAGTLTELEQEAAGIAAGNKSDGTFLEKLTNTLKQMPTGSEEDLYKLLDKDDVKTAVRKELEEALLLEPKDAAELEKVQKYYKKLQGALENYIEVTKQQTADASNLNKTFQNMSDNLNFMHYVNEMMPYIQLPLKLFDENAHGDFYVMRGKKNHVENSDEFTAFLRLNMEHLGEIEVFVKLKSKTADIAFKVESKEICEFIESNITRLEDGLSSKGYGLVASVEQKKEDFSFVKDIIEGDSVGMIEKYSFDMKL